MITVLLVDDHGVVRDALGFLLEAQGDMQIVATAADGLEAVKKTRLFCPDIAVMDVSMPRMDGIEASQEISKHCPSTRIVILTISNSREHIDRALAAGVRGYVLKEAAGRELVEAIRILHAGGEYFSAKIAPVNGPPPDSDRP